MRSLLYIVILPKSYYQYINNGVVKRAQIKEKVKNSPDQKQQDPKKRHK